MPLSWRHGDMRVDPHGNPGRYHCRVCADHSSRYTQPSSEWNVQPCACQALSRDRTCKALLTILCLDMNHISNEVSTTRRSYNCMIRQAQTQQRINMVMNMRHQSLVLHSITTVESRESRILSGWVGYDTRYRPTIVAYCRPNHKSPSFVSWISRVWSIPSNRELHVLTFPTWRSAYRC